ncbi:MAG: hypothetical protein R3A78_09720 [Polyangiales bacterium]|nr:hypothetical protein [Myxococcales bacterium]
MKDRLDRYLSVRREALLTEAELVETSDAEALARALLERVMTARATRASHEAAFELQAVADLLAKLPSIDSANALLLILNDEDAVVRLRAHDALRRWASGRSDDLVRAATSFLESRSGPAVRELPSLLLATADPEGPAPMGLLLRLLDDPDADAAAEAACAIAATDDPDAFQALLPYVLDPRPLASAGRGPRTVGELVEQLVATARMIEELATSPTVGDA